MSYADDLTEAELTALENRIREEYKTSYRAIRAQADKYFSEYEERWQEQYDAYMRGVYTEAEFRAWEQTQLARGERWEALAGEMAQRMTDADIVASAYINDTTPSIYSLHSNYTAYEIGGGVQGVSFFMYDEQTVKLLMQDENFSEFRTVRINPVRDYEWNTQQIQKAITASILQGSDIKQMTNAFLGVMQRNENSARRNARTAFTSAQNGGRLEGMRQAVKQGIKVRKRWLSAHDGRVRDSHAMLDGQIRDVEKAFDNGCMFPSDPAGRPEEVYNCRCTLTYIYPEFDDKKSAEIYRDQALEGETYQQFVKRMSSNVDYDIGSGNRKDYRIDTKTLTPSMAKIIFDTDDQSQMLRISRFVGTYTERKSIWDGVLEIDDTLDTMGKHDPKTGHIRIRSKAGLRTRFHEMIHSYSNKDILLDDIKWPITKIQYKYAEEATIDLIAEEICARNGVICKRSKYHKSVDKMRQIAEATGVDSLAFGLELLDVPASKRYNYIAKIARENGVFISAIF